MENLLKQKENLEHELNSLKKKYDNIKSEESASVTKINTLNNELSILISKYENIRNTIKHKKAIFIKLKSKVKKYKENKYSEIKKKYIDLYNNILKEARSLEFKYNLQVFKVFSELKSVIDKSEYFTNLNNTLMIYYKMKKEILRDLLVNNIIEYKEIHKVIYHMKILVGYEKYFKEELIINTFVDFIKTRSEYHFLSNRETSRLDKVDWMFEYLFNKIVEVQRLYEIYVNLQNATENKTSTGKKEFENMIYNGNQLKEEMNESTTYLSQTEFSKKTNIEKDVIKAANAIIYQKIEQLKELESPQKRNLLLNFNYFLNLYIKNIYAKFNIKIREKFKNFYEYIIEEEKDHVFYKLQEIHKLAYNEWFAAYEELLKEYINLYKKFVDLSVCGILDNIIEYNLIFLDSMRYINRKEIDVLIFIFNKFEDMKEFISFNFNEIRLNGVDIKNDTEKIPGENNHSISYITDMKADVYVEEGNPDLEYSKIQSTDIDAEEDKALDKLNTFNQENYKLIKSLFENDIRNILNIKYYFINDITTILYQYKKCKGFSNLKRLSGSMIDDYLLNEVLLARRIEYSEYTDLMNIFRDLKLIYETKKWRSRECMKCVKGIFEDINIVNEYSERINHLYK